MSKTLPLSILLALLLAACDTDREPATVPAEPDPVRSEPAEAQPDYAEEVDAEAIDELADRVARLEALYEDFFETSLELNPLRATFMGDHRWSDRWPNSLGEEHRERMLEHHKDFLAQLREIGDEGLEGQDLLSYRMFENERGRAIEGAEYPGHLLPINQFRNPVNTLVMLGSGDGAQPFNTVEDYYNWHQRVTDWTVWVDQAITNMREGMEQDIVQPKILIERTLDQLDAHLVDDPADSLLFRPVANLPDDFDESDRLRIEEQYRSLIAETAVPTIQRLRDFLADEYLPACRETAGMNALPGGEEWYAWLVANTTTTDLTPAEIHDIGLAEVERIHGEIRAVMEAVDFDGDMHDFFEFTRTDEQFIFDSPEQLIQAHEDLRDVVDAVVPEYFTLLPEADYEIRPVEPFRERSAAGGSYQRPAADGSRPGIFYANTYDLSARPSWGVEALFLHEAAPGHHFQIALQQETENLPRFRRFGSYTAYVEGWGLYAEYLGHEMGIYEDPYARFGAHAAELWRAIRLVVDTGLHYHGWSREDVLEYMYANSPAAEARAVSEAERYMAIPSQALAYKIGELKIREIRQQAEEALGEDFDIREFHARVLETGAVPLDVLEAHIRDWVEAQRG
jgi:uncharacterized protein (DUF885 family)